jgi:Tfp pilus assembly protein PilP
MKKIVLLLSSALVVAVLASSCQTGYSKSSYIAALEKFVSKVEGGWKSFTEDNWKKADEKMEAFEKKYEKYKKDFTKDEERKVSKLMRKYDWAHLKGVGKSFLENFSDVYEEGKNVFEEAYEGVGDFKETVSGFADSLRSVFNDR